MDQITKPIAGEYAPSPYAIRYINLVNEDTNVFQLLAEQSQQLRDLIQNLPSEKIATPWAPDEWTVKEIIGHVADSERVFAFRAHHCARNDPNPLPRFDPNAYVVVSGANNRNITEILDEFAAIRLATITLFNSFPNEYSTRSGLINGQQVSVRALVYMIAGHCIHHMISIAENYGA